MEYKTILGAAIGAIVAGLAVATFFLHQGNLALEERRSELEVRLQQTEQRYEEVMAEQARLQNPTDLPAQK